MAPGHWQILVVIVLALLLFGGRGKISAIMGDFAKGIKSFRKGLEDDEVALTEDKTVKDTAEIKSTDDTKSASEQSS